MKQTTVAENIEQINAIVACIRRSNGSAPVIFTLSPVPLLLSMTDYPPVPSNVISKSVIRSALHDVMERKFENVHYWPSYEIVDWMGKYTGPIWGQKGNDLRHLEPDIIDGIMRKFSKIYFADAAPA
jgi:hypothetical protein